MSRSKLPGGRGSLPRLPSQIKTKVERLSLQDQLMFAEPPFPEKVLRAKLSKPARPKKAKPRPKKSGGGVA